MTSTKWKTSSLFFLILMVLANIAMSAGEK